MALKDFKILRMAKNHTSTASGQAGVYERVGSGLLRTPRPALDVARSKNLSYGRKRGAKSRGWTWQTRKTNRIALEEHRTEFRSFVHLTLPAGLKCQIELKKLKEKMVRQMRETLPAGTNWHWVLEFKQTTGDPHFHIALTCDPSDALPLEDYWQRVVGGEFLCDRTRNPSDAIARYAQKSKQKVNPDWFASAAFKPYGNNFPRKPRE